MKRLNPTFLLTIADLFVNISAGWFGAAFIVPLASDKPSQLNLWILLLNVFFGIVFFVTTYKLRKIANKRRRL